MMEQIKQSIITSKKLLIEQYNVKKSFNIAQSNIKKEVDIILELQHKEIPVIPEIDFQSIVNGNISSSDIANLKQRGSVIIRNVFDKQQASEWNDEIGEYFYDDGIDGVVDGDEVFSESNFLNIGTGTNEGLNDYSISKFANAFDQKFHICQAITAQLPNYSEPIRLEM